MKKALRKLLVSIGCLGIGLFLLGSTNLANGKDVDYPTKPVTCIYPFGAGGLGDVLTRALVDVSKKYLGQDIVYLNKAGGGGSIGTLWVINSKPDGYTIGIGSGSGLFVVPFSEGAPYTDLSGFSFIMNFSDYVNPVIVRSDSPWKTWREFIDWARKNPGAVKVSVVGGKKQTCQGMVLRVIEQKEKVKFTYVPFKSGPEGTTALLGGYINTWAQSIDVSTYSLLDAGKIRVLLYMTADKMLGHESPPTTIELYNFRTPNMLGFFGPKGIPEDALNKLEDAFTKGTRDPDFINVMKQLRMPSMYMNRDDTTKFVEKMFRENGELLKKLDKYEADEEAKGKK